MRLPLGSAPGSARATAPATASALVLTLAAALALTGCQPEHTPIIPTPVPSTTPIFASDEEALAAAEEAYRAFQVVSDQILADGGKEPERLEDLVTTEVYATEVATYEEWASRGWHEIGHTQIISVSLESYSPTANGGKGAVVVYACTDLSNTDVLDSSGKSVVNPDRVTAIPFQTSFDFDESSGRLLLSEKVVWTGANFCS